jgi:hypothetical protein
MAVFSSPDKQVTRGLSKKRSRFLLEPAGIYPVEKCIVAPIVTKFKLRCKKKGLKSMHKSLRDMAGSTAPGTVND